MRIRSLLAAAALLPTLLLAGCVPTGPLPIDPPDPDIPGGSGDGPVTGVPAVDEPFFATLDTLKADLDEWRDGWLRAQCTPEVVVDDALCSIKLSEGAIVATSIQILFAGTGIADFDGHPQVGDLAAAQDAALAAYVADVAWNDAACVGVDSTECLEIALDLGPALLSLHEGLLTWSH